MNDKIYIDGLFVNKPNENAPHFVIAKCSINADKLIDFIKRYANSKGYINFDIKSGQKGYYAELNTWTPKTVEEHKEAVMNEGEEIDINNFQPEDEDEIEVNEIPF